MAKKRTIAWSGHDAAKDRLRLMVWTRLRAQGAAVGDPVGHIPRFLGADQAAARLAALPVWQQAIVIKCNPDAAQAPVRLRALQDGKVLYMAVPRLSHGRCFVQLTATALRQQGIALEVAALHRGAMQYGQLVGFDDMVPIALAVVGCVAVAPDGGRTGKGAGFADLELGMLRQLELVQAATPIVTTVHPLQIVAPGQLPMRSHDWSLTWIVTPEAAMATHSLRPQPPGLLWEHIRPEQYATIPVLQTLRPDGTESATRGAGSAPDSPPR